MKTLLLMIIWVLFSFNSYSQILVGATTEGGPDGNGEIFKYDVGMDEFEILNSFPSIKTRYWYNFVNATNGKVYCLSSFWSSGELIEYDPVSNQYDILVNFNDSTGSFAEGLVYDSITNALYGTNHLGGLHNTGVIYKYSLENSEYEILYHFEDSSGMKPQGAIVLINDSLLYGATYSAYDIGPGVVFAFNIETKEYSDLNYFSQCDGSNKSGLFLANNGKLYGTTYLGGINGDGMLFEFDPETNALTKLYDFIDSTGSWAMTKLVEPIDGKLYGITYSGGSKYCGVIFEYDYIDSVYSVKFSFDCDAGKPYQNIVELEDGILYGATTCCSTYGRIYSYNVNTEEFSFVCDFNMNTGSWPTGEFFRCSNSKIISASTGGASFGNGALVEFDNITDTIIKVSDFAGNYQQKIYGTPTYKDGKVYFLSNNKPDLVNDYCILSSIDVNQNNHRHILDALYNVDRGLTYFNNQLFYFSSNYMSGYHNIRVFDIDQGKVVSTPNGYGTGHLTLGDDGKLYGMRAASGDFPFRIFKLDPVSYSYETVFTHYGPNKPEPFENSFTPLSNGKLLGLTSNSGGADTSGLIFEFDIYDKEYVELYDFSNSAANVPTGELIEYEEGVYYGLSQFGGDNGFGTIFYISEINK